MTYNLDEVFLIPSSISKIEHRDDCNIYYGDKLPLFISPMTSLIDINNRDLFEDLGFNTILPRTIDFDTRVEQMKSGKIAAFGLKEAEYLYNTFSHAKSTNDLNYIPKICIDQANGHMSGLLNICLKLKELLGQDGIWIMTGNIANYQTYYEYAKVGIDAVRIGIGSGDVCTTSIQTGIHYPMASLISDCRYAKGYVEACRELDIDGVEKKVNDNSVVKALEDSKEKYKSVPLIIADGGFKRIDQIIKALALGADYVMLGEIIAKSKEACGEVKWKPIGGIHHNSREYYGMSTHKAQYDINKNSNNPSNTIKPSEGVSKWVPIEYSINEWLDSFKHSIKSSMSYCSAESLNEYIGRVDWDVMSNNTFQLYNQNKKAYTWQ